MLTDGWTDRRTDGQTDICTSRAAFAAENEIQSERIVLFIISSTVQCNDSFLYVRLFDPFNFSPS